MGSKPLRVMDQWIYPAAGVAIRLDTPAWFAWLDETGVQSFAYPVLVRQVGYIVGYLTIRKERRQRGGTYWVAYQRVDGRLRKVYIGRSTAVTQARLDTIALAQHPTTTPPEHAADGVASALAIRGQVY